MNDFLINFTALFVAMDIIGTVPMYLNITQGMKKSERAHVVNASMVTAISVALLFIFLGRELFKHLGIQIQDFKIAGGLILLLISLTDLIKGPEGVQKGSGHTGIVPLAVPLITGPGVLATLMLQVQSTGYTLTLLALFANALVAWVILQKCESITRVIGKDGTVVLSKIAALLLAAIAISMIRSGIFELIGIVPKS